MQIPNLHSPGCLLWINPTSFRSGFTFLVKFLFFNRMKHLIFVDELSCLSQSYQFKLCCPMFNYFEPLFGSTSTSSKKIIILLLFFITLKKKKKEIESLSCKSGVSPYEKCPNKARLIFFDELSCLSFR